MPSNLFEYHTMGVPPPQGLSPMPGYNKPAVAPRRFSFNFPSGKKWTLSPADDARARAFYCGGGPVVEPPVVQVPPPPPPPPPPGGASVPQPKMVCGGYIGWDGNSVFTEPNNRGEMIAWYTGGRCSPIFGGVRTG